MDCTDVYEIKRTWEIPMANPSDSGVAILVKFFSKYPSNLEKFSAFKDTPIDQLEKNPRFRAHANRIISTFDESIQSLGYDWSPSKLETIWSEIAKSHMKRTIQKQAYNELKETILEVLTAVCNLNEKQVAAWCKLTDIVYDIIFRTMDQLGSEAN